MSDQFITLRNTHAAQSKILRSTEDGLYLKLQMREILAQQVTAEKQKLGLRALPANHQLSKSWVDNEKSILDLQVKLDQERALYRKTGKAFYEAEPIQARVSNLSDDVPVLMFPLRVQTRFRTTKYIARNCPASHVLNINALPPQFRLLTQAQLPNIEAGSTNTDFLVSILSNKSTARDLIKTLSPDNAKRWKKQEDVSELLVRIYPDDIFLQTHESALTLNEQKSGEVFWKAMWSAEQNFKSDHDAAKKLNNQQTAWHQLVSTHKTQRCTWIVRVMYPLNYEQAEVKNPEQLTFQKVDTKSAAWTKPADTYLLPDAFVVRVYFTETNFKEYTTQPIAPELQLGLNPSEAPGENPEQADGTLRLPESIRWLTDFDTAEKLGMALRISLTQAQMDAGIKRLVVLGVKTAASAEDGRVLLEELWQNHIHKPYGFSFVPLGTPTNNLEGQPTGFNPEGQSSLQSFDLQFGKAQFDSNSTIVTDAQRFAFALGVDSIPFQRIANAGMTNASSALLLNQALWPATLGYYLDHFLAPAVDAQDIAHIRQFFQNQVLGSGSLPTFRVGNQPYGLLISSAFSRWQLESNSSPAANRFFEVLKKLDTMWAGFSQSVLKLSNLSNNDRDKWLESFKNLLAQQAHSVEFAHRYVVGKYLLRNVSNAIPDPKSATPLMVGQSPLSINSTPEALKQTMEQASNWGRPFNKIPAIFSKFFADTDVDLIKWKNGTRVFADIDLFPLQTLLQKSVDELWDTPSISNTNGMGKLLYFLSRQALLRAYIEAAMNKARQDKPQETSPLAQLDFEMEYLIARDDPNALFDLSTEHLARLANEAPRHTFKTLKNKKAYLDRISNGKKVSAIIAEELKKSPPGFDLNALSDSLKAFNLLKDLPHQHLEKLLVDHLDVCNYRLDAWMLGLASERLGKLRAKPQGKGIHLAAFGYLENLKPANDLWIDVKLQDQPVTLTIDRNTPTGTYVLPILNVPGADSATWAKHLARGIVYLGSDPNFQIKANPDQASGFEYKAAARALQGHGFIVAPSLAHAATAAVLHSGYQQNKQKGNDQAFAVNINADRVGKAMNLLRGVQAGHSLNEQFGYWLERKMYENKLGAYVRPMRKAFPLYSETQEWNSNNPSRPSSGNMTLSIDGLVFLETYQKNRTEWQSKVAPIVPPANLNILNKLVVDLLDIYDALSDLLLAEGVFQMVQGNAEKASLALKMGGNGGNITLPEITKIAAPFQLFGQRMALVLNGVGNDQSWPVSKSPLSTLLPQLNEWLSPQLPKLEKIKLSARVDAATEQLTFDFSILELQPLDLLLRLKSTQFSKDDTGLIYLAQLAVRKVGNISALSAIEIDFNRNANFKADEYSLVELLPILKSIWKLLSQGRALQPSDWFPEPFLAQQSPDVLITAPLEQGVNKIMVGTGANTIQQYLQLLQTQINTVRALLEENLQKEAGQKSIQQLLKTVLSGAAYGAWDIRPQLHPDTSSTFRLELTETAERLKNTLQERFEKIQAISLSTESAQRFNDLSNQIQVLYGDDVPLFPMYKLPNAKDVLASWDDKKLQEAAGPFATEEWLQGLAPIFDNAGHYLGVQVLRESMAAKAAGNALKIVQLPFLYDQANIWAGGPLPQGHQLPSGTVALAIETMSPLANNQVVGGFVFEEWREKIPLLAHNAGVAIHYEQPDYAEPAQALLLAVPAQIKGNWEWDDLIQTILDTMQMARKRAVQPSAYQNTWLNQFLPALIAPIDSNRNTAGIDFGNLRSYKPIIERPPIGGTGGGTVLIKP